MKTVIEYAVYFYEEREASITVNSKSKTIPAEFNELFLFCTYAFRQVHNIGQNHPVSVALGKSLSEVKSSSDALSLTLVNPDNKSDIADPLMELSTHEISMLAPGQKRVQKGFRGEVRQDARAVQFVLNPQGFNILGEGVNYYAPLSVGLLLNYLAEQRNNEKYVTGLSRAARQCGGVILRQGITMSNQMPLAQGIAESLFSWGIT